MQQIFWKIKNYIEIINKEVRFAKCRGYNKTRT